MRGARRLTYGDSRMKAFLFTLLHLAVIVAKLLGHRWRARVAENFLLKQQLIGFVVIAGGRLLSTDHDPVFESHR